MLVIERSFIALLWLSSVLLSLNFFLALGFWSNIQVHIVFGSISTLLALFAHIATIFYFVGTSRWIKDQADEVLARDKEKAFRIWTYYMDANKLKAYAMPFPTISIFLGLFGFIFGGALQVGAVDKWVHVLIASLFLIFTWLGLFFAMKGLKRTIEYLNSTTNELEQLN